MRDIESALRSELRDPEYSEGYAESFLNTYIASQIKVIREQREMTQSDLGEAIGTTQAGVSRYENANYSSWNIRTLIKIARAFHLRLKVSFEPFGTLPNEVVRFGRQSLERVPREEDLGLREDDLTWTRPLRPSGQENFAGADLYLRQAIDQTAERELAKQLAQTPAMQPAVPQVAINLQANQVPQILATEDSIWR
ncbi:helix-turn-helix transcriptional regulator [Alloacidobacterium dinghuense]|uniref:Helix-turn-helix transcriptional regulator n=1 Tax=Alloacidobacterium dinghuense TaxID=2763107 RepID=A0A7G8BEU9_9BACT|nr:helix-turn-helix transcriptional regulator [Alloacidobacterium dinghuense]QNI31069.1 helix-turn-helix transcriptional regulator [Alloacidobacterium dinghuense]